MLKAIGFLKKHNLSYTCAKEEYSFLNKTEQDNLLVSNICQYLDNGKIVIAFLHYHQDGREPIAPAIIYTDGVWVWPSYYAYYIKKHPDIYIPEEFMTDAAKNNYTVPEIEDGRQQYVQYLVMTQLMNQTLGSRIKLSATLLQMIEVVGSEIICH